MNKIIVYHDKDNRREIVASQEKIGLRMVSDTFFIGHNEMIFTDEQPEPAPSVVRDLAAEIDALATRITRLGG